MWYISSLRDTKNLFRILTNRDKKIDLCKLISRNVYKYLKSGKKSWNVMFFGADNFSLESLKKLHNEYKLNNTIKKLEVVTTCKEQQNVVEKYAKSNGIVVHSWPMTESITNFDIGFVVSFGHLIPACVINCFPLGILNVHASLLPRWRGASPINYSLMKGDSKTGVTIMKISPRKFDIGEIISQRETIIRSDETFPELYSKLAKLGADSLIQTFNALPEILMSAIPQTDIGITYAPKLMPQISEINWDSMTAKNIYDLQRSLLSIYTLTTQFNNTRIKLIDITELFEVPNLSRLETTFRMNKVPGLVVYSEKRNALLVMCKNETWITVPKLLFSGRRIISAKDFNNGVMSGQKLKFIYFQNFLCNEKIKIIK